MEANKLSQMNFNKYNKEAEVYDPETGIYVEDGRISYMNINQKKR